MCSKSDTVAAKVDGHHSHGRKVTQSGDLATRVVDL